MMNCKNCHSPLKEGDSYCANCGAKVIRERVTTKKLFSEFIENVFGWDNRYLVTFIAMVMRPQAVLGEYVDGVRKRYVNPFTFFVIGMTVTLILFNQFEKQYLELATRPIVAQIEAEEEAAGSKEAYESLLKKRQNPFSPGSTKEEVIEHNKKIQRWIVKYYNLLALLFMPFYALLAWLVFRKPLNYAEHLIAGLYIQGMTFWGTTVAFLVTLLTKADIFFFSLLFTVAYYLYAYARLYKLSTGKVVLSFFKFLGWLIAFALVFGVIVFGVGIAYAVLSGKLGG
ncbi:MAG: DUF3667 domain-containing protein [Bacteroidota bacterium]